MTRIDGKLQQSRNQYAILYWIHRFGWLTSAEVALLVWPQAKRSLDMANRTLNQLVERDELSSRPLPKSDVAEVNARSQVAYALSVKGAKRLRNECDKTKAAANGAMLDNLAHHQHRILSNRFVIWAISRGYSAYTEREVGKGWIIDTDVDGKVADALIFKCEDDERNGFIHWVEVEQQIFPPQVWVLKRELLFIPFFGWGLAMASPIAINRAAGREALKQLAAKGKERLKQGFFVVIFPEGTRVAPGTTGKYHIGGAWLAAQTKTPVVPVAHNAGEYWSKNSFLKRPGTITLSIGKPIDANGLKADELNQRVEAWIEKEMLLLDRK